MPVDDLLTDTPEQTRYIRKLTILYDDRCKLCVSIMNWLANAPTWIEFEFIGLSACATTSCGGMSNTQ